MCIYTSAIRDTHDGCDRHSLILLTTYILVLTFSNPRNPKPMLQKKNKINSRAIWYGRGQVGRAGPPDVLSVGGWCGQLAPSLIYWSPPVRCWRHTARHSAGRFHSLNLHHNWSISHQHRAIPRAAAMIYPPKLAFTRLLRLTTHHSSF